MSQNTAQRPPNTTGYGAGTGTGAGIGAGPGTGTGAGTGAHTGKKGAWALGGSLFAGVVMLIAGATDILQGVSAVRRDTFLNGVTGYAYAFDITSWGWIHVGLGALLALTGLAILMGSRIARFIGIGVVALNLVAQFLWLPYQPLWAIVGMALSAFIIWALATDRRPARA